MNNQNNRPNRLINEKSPYLLQHAYNPVQWFPWGEEAFEKARLEISLFSYLLGTADLSRMKYMSLVHVMERESFENEVIGEILNREYVCVKVDREERPDVDSVYMSVCQAMNGQGGWPLTIIMTPDCRPFFPVPIFLPGPVMAGRVGRTADSGSAGQWKVKKKTSGPGRSDREIPKKPGTDRKAGRAGAWGGAPGIQAVGGLF